MTGFGHQEDDRQLLEVLLFSLNGQMPLPAYEILDQWSLYEEPGWLFPFDNPYLELIDSVAQR